MTDELQYTGRMSAADGLMWYLERDPLLRSTVASVWVLDKPLNKRRLGSAIDRAVEAVPRLRQRAVMDAYSIAPPVWEDDPRFDRSHHVTHGRVGGDGTLLDVLEYASRVAFQAFDKDRPLWEFHVLDGLEGGQAAVIMKLHHAISDGMGMARMMLGMVDLERDPKGKTAQRPTEAVLGQSSSSELELLGNALMHRARSNVLLTSRWLRAYGRTVRGLVTRPVGTLNDVRETAASVARLMKPISEPLSPLLANRSLNGRFRVIQRPVAEFKRAAKAVDGTLNDVFVAAVLGGLAAYHREHGVEVDELRMNMPINVREGAKGSQAGNQFVPVRFHVPLTIDDPIERMIAVHELVQEQRDEPALKIVDDVQEVMTRLGPRAATAIVGSMMKALDLVTSNVPGPQFPLYMAGAKLLHSYPFGPLAGAALNITLFSYDGTVHIGINADSAAVEDCDQLAACIEEGIEELFAAVDGG